MLRTSRTNSRIPSDLTNPGQVGDGGCDASGDVASVANYVADMCGELAALAGRAQLPMLAYFLNLARVEAEMRCRSLASGFTRAEAERFRDAR